MRRNVTLGLLAAAAVALLLQGCASSKSASDTARVDPANLAVFHPPLPETMASEENPMTTAKVDLGRMLFFETRISASGDISCNSCHRLSEYGVDHEATSPGHEGKRGSRNSPTVYNAAGHVSQFWDGRAADVEEQAKGPVLNPIEMGMPSEEQVVAILKDIPGYVAAFEAAFPGEPDPVSYDNFGRAIGAFERTLVTPAPLDAYLAGDTSALTPDQVRGLELFVETGCAGCHASTYLGGSMYQKLGMAKPWPDQHDLGRYQVTQNENDRMVFKVPSLRNVTRTSPYYHDGSAKDLEQAVKLMARHQLGKSLSDADTRRIVAFLDAATGTLPADKIAEPQRP